MCSRSVVSSFLWLACQAFPSTGFSRQEYWSGLWFPSPGDLLDPGIELRPPALRADLTIWATRDFLKVCSRPVLNQGPFVCQADVITTTLQRRMGSNITLRILFCVVLSSTQFTVRYICFIVLSIFRIFKLDNKLQLYWTVMYFKSQILKKSSFREI